MLVLYTQPRCGYCDVMKKKLDTLEKKYYTIDITNNPEALAFMKERGHNTVPQLYIESIHVNKKNTLDLTNEELNEAILSAEQETLKWPGEDSGIDQVI